MTYVYQFDIAAILLNIMLIFIILMRNPFPSRLLKVYKGMLYFNLIATIADLISAFTLSYPALVPLAVNYVINMLYLLTHNVAAVFFLLYVIVLIRGNFGKKWERCLWIGVLVVDVLIVTTTPLTKQLFYFDASLNYCHGPLIYVLYFCAFLILGYSLYLLLFSRYLMSKFQMASNILFLSMLLVAVVLQFFYPHVLIESFCAALSFMMMNVALDNPAKYFYRDSACYNQTAFLTMLERELFFPRFSYSVVAFTIDDLSLFRKKFGDEEYDFMLQTMIKRCHSLFGQKQVFLLSRDVFAVLLDPKYEDEGKAIADLTAKIGAPYTMLNGGSMALTPHFCLVRNQEKPQSAGDLLVVIDDMLFHTYQKTGLRVIWDTSSVLAKKHREDEIIHVLHKAINEDGFEVFYQPIFNQRENCFDSMEALLRLKDNSLKIFPDEFIPVAEQNGMILEIGAIVFQKVCKFWQENRLEEVGIKHVNVNLSVLQLLRKSAVEELANTAKKFGVSPENIHMEITETATADAAESNNVKDSLTYLHKAGFEFALDDYGSGYSNLSLLAEMPFVCIKIDKQILWKAMKGNENFNVILKNSLGLIKQTGKQSLVEGVETEEMAELLKKWDCDFFQGFLYSKPLPANQVFAFLQEKNQR